MGLRPYLSGAGDRDRAQPSTSGDPLDSRRTRTVYSATGNATSRTIEGVEDGFAFAYTTAMMFTAEGVVDEIDPPGYGTGDVTSFTYDPARGNVLADARIDPIVGTTTFGYDAFNRRTSTTDPNGLVVETQYDDLDRVRFVIHRGAVPADDLTTEHRYTVWGDLFQTVLPEGNVIEYGYDHAGRLVSIERKPDDQPTSHGERVVYTLDGFGHRVREERQRWDGGAWIVEGATENVYSTRCHLDQTIQGAGSASESITEYAYDCDGNLERVWDANHPSAGQTQPATAVYVYDALDRLSTVTQPWGGAGGGSVVTTYVYDVQDHLTSVVDGEGNPTTYAYSDRDLLTEEISLVSGTTTHTYNEHGELVTSTDARGVTSARTVDALDRVTAVSYPTSSLDVAYSYDTAPASCTSTERFPIGRLAGITRHGETVEYCYDRFGRPTRDGTLLYGYDKNGNRTAIGYPDGVDATYGFDFADREKHAFRADRRRCAGKPSSRTRATCPPDRSTA